MDDRLKARLYPALIAFGLTVIVLQLAFNMNALRFSPLVLTMRILGGVAVGVLVGGIAFAIAHFMQK